MNSVSPHEFNDLVCKVRGIQNQLYLNAYKKVFPDKLSYVITADKHKLTYIKGYLFLSPNGEEVEVSLKINSEKTVTIESNLSLLNCTLILF